MAVRGTSPEPAPIVQRKLAVPSLPEHRVERPRVEGTLVALAERHRVVVVSATAGAGKTTAVAAAVRSLDRPVAWLTLDWSDAAPGRLVTYLEAAFAQQLPEVSGRATRALAAGIPHGEAAGLLAEAIGDAPIVLVLDELERLGDTKEAWEVIETFLRYAPTATSTLLVSRRAVPSAVAPPPSAAALGEGELSFTATEATEALARIGAPAVDAAAAVEATGGWVTGVLFEAWRSEEHVAGMGGEADPLHGYLAAHILDQLDPRDAEFLVVTSPLDEVTAPRAAALGQADAAQRLAALSMAHLPVTWRSDRRALRCHPRFREYLLERLERRVEPEVRAIRVAHGRLLADEGRHEDAVEELLLAGAREEALASAQRAILGLVERLDVAIAERWLATLGPLAPHASPAFTIAELMLALGRSNFARAVRVADALADRGERDALARSSTRAAALIAWAYMLVGDLDELHAVLDVAEESPDVQAVRYALANLEPGPPPARPPLTGGPFDALVLASDLACGRLAELDQESASRWIDAISGARQIALLRATGRTQRALELYEQARRLGQATVQLEAWTGPEVLIDAGRAEEAHDAIARGRDLAHQSGSPLYEGQTWLVAAKLALRLERDPRAAYAALEPLEAYRAEHPFPFLCEPLDTWYGLALLLEGRDAEALARLRNAVQGMVAGDRMLELPTAAVYLAEAHWRAGDEDAADEAADLALEAARRQGSNHVLLQALADFPAVLSRRIDAEPGADSPWHEVGRALIAQRTAVQAPVRAAVELVEFGRCAILVDGEEERPRIAKAYELLAFLVTRPGTEAGRGELLDALFDGRVDESTRSYLRQAARWLRHALPDEGALVVERGRMRLGDDLLATSESARFESALAVAARLQGDERLTATVEALAVFDQGEYLPGTHSHWVDGRRQRLVELATDARYEAAELAFAAGNLDQADQLAAQALTADPFREAAWRLTMRIASALGDDDGVIRAYQRCERALAQLGTEPAPSTRELLGRLRR
jgi:ATP/maltotriose-dependent transcriptional regulator MalT/DNA-binding SARP family transcriptional activator